MSDPCPVCKGEGVVECPVPEDMRPGSMGAFLAATKRCPMGCPLPEMMMDYEDLLDEESSEDDDA